MNSGMRVFSTVICTVGYGPISLCISTSPAGCWLKVNISFILFPSHYHYTYCDLQYINYTILGHSRFNKLYNQITLPYCIIQMLKIDANYWCIISLFRLFRLGIFSPKNNLLLENYRIASQSIFWYFYGSRLNGLISLWVFIRRSQ